jgi:hypothetical protein
MTAENLKLIKDALYIIAREENEAIERVIASSPKPSESLYRRCDEMVDELLKKQKRCLPIKKAITILIASAIIISMFAITAYALRDKIGGFFVDIYEKYVELSTDKTEASDLFPKDIMIGYIPDDFIETRQLLNDCSGTFDWENGTQYISLYFRLNSNGIHMTDNECSDFTTVEVGDVTVFRTRVNSQINATWTDGEMIYTLSATGIEWDEMVKIIEGIKIEE